MRLRIAILMSWSLAWLGWTGCTGPETSPYLREVRPAYDCVDTAGAMLTGLACRPLPGYYTIPKPYLEHMLNDLKACYREAAR